jgi:hypothetical protein
MSCRDRSKTALRTRGSFSWNVTTDSLNAASVLPSTCKERHPAALAVPAKATVIIAAVSFTIRRPREDPRENLVERPLAHRR